MYLRNIWIKLYKNQRYLIWGGIFGFGLLLSYLIATRNINLIGALVAIIGLLLVVYFHLSAIFILFLIIFTGDQFTDLGLIPHIFPDVLISILILVLFFKAIFLKIHSEERIKLWGVYPVLALLLVCFVSALYNGGGGLRLALFLRHVIQFYLFFLALLNLELIEKELKKVNIFLMILFLIQIPTALIKWFVFGYSELTSSFGGEAAIGTYGTKPGAMSTLLPLLAIGFLFPLYVGTRKKVYLLMIMGFILFSFLGGKRAFPLVLPLFGLYLILLMRSQLNFNPSLKSVLAGIFILFLALILGAKLHPTLNPSHKVWGEFSPRFLLDMALNYTSAIVPEGHTIGRFSSTQRILAILGKEGGYSLFLGKGPGVFLKSGVLEETFYQGFRSTFGIQYGFTGFVWLFAQTGILGVLCILWLIFLFFKEAYNIYQKTLPPYWKIFIAGVLAALMVTAFDFIAYSTNFIAGKLFPSVVYYSLAVMIIQNEKKIIQENSKQSKPPQLL